MQPIRTYQVIVRGFPPILYSARSPSKARAACWHDYQVMDDRLTTFRDFLAMSSIRRVPDPPGIGERILVAGGGRYARHWSWAIHPLYARRQRRDLVGASVRSRRSPGLKMVHGSQAYKSNFLVYLLSN